MKQRDDELLWVPENDSQGRTVNKEVLKEAHAVWRRALAHIERRCSDTSQANAIMESTVFTISRLMERKVIRNLRSFTYLVFRRKVLRHLQKESRYVSLDSLPEEQFMVDCVSAYENELEVKLFLRRLDHRVQTMFSMRSAGYSWKEIGDALGLPPHNAESQFGYRIQKQIEKLNAGDDKEEKR
jgi:DNA-directed RNA polymerase specialized sigma24 family protein